MSLASLRATFRRVFNTPDEEIQGRIAESDADGDMCISKGVTENICLITLQNGFEFARIKETSPDVATVCYVSDEEEQEYGELPMEQAIYLVKRMRVHANIDGWGHLASTPYEMEVSCQGNSFHISITEFQLKPTIDVLFKVMQVDGS